MNIVGYMEKSTLAKKLVTLDSSYLSETYKYFHQTYPS